ncbi:unnamed protein product, partial [Candidula unifasciata]
MTDNDINRDSYIKTCGEFILPAYTSLGTLNYNIHNQHAVYSNLYPYHSYRKSKQNRLVVVLEISCSRFTNCGKRNSHWSKLFSNLNKMCLFPKVYASDIENNSDVNAGKEGEVHTADTAEEGLSQSSLEALAKAYIARETGMDRVRMLLKKDYKGESSPQMVYIKTALVPIALIGFFLNYLPAYKFAKSEFIREHNATVFKTHTEAVRKMSDYASVEAILAGGRLSLKVTTFCASVLLISQFLASYRNKTSVSDYVLASGITGGLARLNMGPKGFVAGSAVGLALGTVYGVVASGLLHLCGMTEDVIHLEQVISRLEVERSIAGESIFKQRIKELTEQASGMATSS